MTYLLLDIDWTIFDKVFMGEPISHYIWFTVIILATVLLKKPMAVLLARISSSLTVRFSYLQHKEIVKSMLFRPAERLLQVMFYFVAFNQLTALQESVHIYHLKTKGGFITLGDVIDHVFLFLFIIFFTQVIGRIIDFIFYMRMDKAQTDKNHSQQQLFPLIKEVSKLVTWSLTLFWILGSVFHVNVPALITGLGIGGVAIALAGKETVENFFAAFTLLSDKPFQVGDMIKLGEIEGAVERIGFRSTRLRNNDGSAIVIPNQHLVSQNMVNLSARDTRGIKLVANLRYGVTHEALQQITKEVREVLHNSPPVKDPIDITLETMDKETMQLTVSYHLPHPLPEGMKLTIIKHDTNLKIFEIISRYAKLGAVTSSS